jgi:hypothetical protein
MRAIERRAEQDIDGPPRFVARANQAYGSCTASKAAVALSADRESWSRDR